MKQLELLTIGSPRTRRRKDSAPGRTSSRFTDLDADKLRGGYYTSREVAAWLAEWAIHSPADTVLEPSCGDGIFLEAAASRLCELGAHSRSIGNQLIGIEILAAEADRARARLRRLFGLHGQVVKTGDFFAWWQRPAHQSFDVVVGNPPFIRYQTFPEPHRNLAMTIMADLGMMPNRLTNSWVPFVAAAAASLRPGGRLAFVLPAELLQVTYASQLRSFLTDHFARIDIVACNELFFDHAEQEVVLLLADGALRESSSCNECRVTLTEAHTVAQITDRPPTEVLARTLPKTVRHDDEKWLKYFLTEREIALMRALRAAPSITALKTHASVDVGVVTGKNEFFVLSKGQVDRLGVASYTVPLISRSAHLQGACIGTAEWQSLADAGDRVHLLHLAPLNGSKPTPRLASYLQCGETNGVHQGYKCSIRLPWYAVPSVWVSDAFVFRQIYDFPRVVLNQAGATSTDTIHRLRSKAAPDHLVSNVYTHLTAASAEIEGRSYGGGVLELEPTEAERLLVPAKLGAALPLAEADRLIRAGRIDQVLIANDALLLRGEMGLSRAECTALRDIWIKMRDRRLVRRRRGRRSPQRKDADARATTLPRLRLADPS
jgi:adenine-specific DNA-methyltransferase